MLKPTAIILAAGANSRFFPFNTRIHKGGIEICGLPLIVRTLQGLQGLVEKVVIVRSDTESGQATEDLVKSRTDLSDLDIHFVVQFAPKGMGDAVLAAQEFVDEQMFILSPYSVDSREILTKMMDVNNSEGVMVVSETSEPWLYGIVTIEDDRVASIVEKPIRGHEPTNLKDHCIYLMPKDYLQTLTVEPEGEYNFESAMNSYVKTHQVKIVTLTSRPSLKYPWHLFDWKNELLKGMSSLTAADATVAATAVIDDSHGPVVISSGAKIGHAAKIIGPSFIGENAFIGDFSFVRESNVEREAVIGANTEVARSIILPQATIHWGYMADSILGYDATVGAGLITANKRHDREFVKVSVKGELVSTDRHGFGAMIGDGAKLGVRVTTMPGVCIGADVVVWPGVMIYRNIEHGETVKGK